MKNIWILTMVFCTACVGGSQKPDSKTELAKYPRDTFKESGLKLRYRNATSLDYSIHHGTQVTYTAPNGTAFLWYPGNTSVVVGDWKTITDKQGDGRICFRYSKTTYNPVTRSYGGNWDCIRAADYIWQEEEFAKGDPFNLQSRRLPYVIPRTKDHRPFDDLAKPLGIAIKPTL